MKARGQRHALLLAAGELRRVMVQPVPEAHALQQFHHLGVVPAGPAQLERHEDVLPRRQRRDELEILEDEADAFVAHERPLVLGHSADLAPIQLHAAGRGPVEAGAEAEERGLAAAGGADDRAGAAGRQGEGNLVQDRERPGGRGIGLGQALDF